MLPAASHRLTPGGAVRSSLLTLLLALCIMPRLGECGGRWKPRLVPTVSEQYVRREITLGLGDGSSCENWSGKEESTCGTFSSLEDLSNSLCASVEHTIAMKQILNDSVDDTGLWCPCGNHSCSMILRVANTSRIAEAKISAWVDARAEILILAEFSSDLGELFEIGKLQNKEKYKEGFRRVQFKYFRDEYIDLSEINVTIVRNGGFALMDTFAVVLEESTDITTTTVRPPPTDLFILDTRKDTSRIEWVDASCHYSDYHEDFWTYGCPVNSDSNYLPQSFGFWYPCHERSCSFVFDGRDRGKLRQVILQGHFYGGEVTISGKSSITGDSHWRQLTVQSFHNSTMTRLQFDLNQLCNVHVLLITIFSDQGNLILIDKIEVQTDPSEDGKECHSVAAPAMVPRSHCMTNTNTLHTPVVLINILYFGYRYFENKFQL